MPSKIRDLITFLVKITPFALIILEATHFKLDDEKKSFGKS